MRDQLVVPTWRASAAVVGGLLWIGFGSRLALRPARVPDVSFRASTDVLPWLGAGLLLIALTAGALSREPCSRAESWQRWASRSVGVGAVLYACGHAFRQFLSGAWEPAVPLGLLLSVASLLVLGGSLLRTRLLPSWAGAAVLLSGLLLLTFNDQYLTAWLSVPFGAIWAVLGLYLLRQDVASTPGPVT